MGEYNSAWKAREAHVPAAGTQQWGTPVMTSDGENQAPMIKGPSAEWCAGGSLCTST